jgi:hypothetical protein
VRCCAPLPMIARECPRRGGAGQRAGVRANEDPNTPAASSSRARSNLASSRVGRRFQGRNETASGEIFIGFSSVIFRERDV